MLLENELQVYENVEVSCFSGEIESYEEIFFKKVIRRRELDFIKRVLRDEKPRLVLDYGCGGGWLSRLICKWGFEVVGIDLSKRLVKIAKFVCREGDFVVCDAMRLPFRDCAFDFIIGISILHHLPRLSMALSELKRVSTFRAVCLFMEPNSLNPVSAFGRKIFPMEAHTKGEKPFAFGYLKTVLGLVGFTVEKYFALFFIAFPIARLLKVMKTKPPPWMIKAILLFENVMEKMPLIRCLNSNIVVLVRA
jgi:ubiquinone/menaquinone biosynthesis C-methylase UbiE